VRPKKKVNKSSLTFFLGRLALSHLRLIRFPFCLRLAGVTVEVFLPASTRGKETLKRKEKAKGKGNFGFDLTKLKVGPKMYVLTGR
jgi:hypothetical protein